MLEKTKQKRLPYTILQRLTEKNIWFDGAARYGPLHSNYSVPVAARRHYPANVPMCHGPHVGVLIKSYICHWLPLTWARPHLPLNHAFHWYPQFMRFHPWSLWPCLLPPFFNSTKRPPPCLSSIDWVEHLLCCAESTSVILQSNDHRLTLAMYEGVMLLWTNRRLTDWHTQLC